jgi:tetratricopeptide (TPR) repeat protein
MVIGRTGPLLGSLLLLAGATASVRAQRPEYVSPAGVSYYAQPDSGAIALAESARAALPRNVDRIIQLGLAEAAARQYREAIATYTRGLAIAPDNALLYRYRGHRYISVREFDRALADLERGARLDTTNYDIWYHLGVVHYVRGEFGAAADAFARARPMAPNDNELAGSTDWLWMALSRAGRRAEATAVLATLRDSMQVTSARAYLQRLRLYQGRIKPADVIGPADTTDIQAATLSYGIGNWFLVGGDTSRARQWFQRSVASGGWPAFGFIAAELELARLR